jgi:hypothetical protein
MNFVFSEAFRRNKNMVQSWVTACEQTRRIDAQTPVHLNPKLIV